MARPSDYNNETATHICSQLASGNPLVRICREDSMPHVATVYRWLLANETFRDMYARAREDQADTLADEIVAIADDSTGDFSVQQVTDGVVASSLNAENIQRSRLRVEARKWVAAKLKPRKYGDKVTQEITGAGGGPVQTIGAAMSPEQAAHAYKQIMG